VLAKSLAMLAFAFGGIHVGAHQVLHVGYAPAWSPNGLRIAYVTKGDLWVADANGTHQGLIDKKADTPSWSPNGKQLAFERDGYIWTVRADGADEHRLAQGFHPDWVSGSDRIVFDRNGEIISDSWFGGDPHVIARGEDPAYSPGGVLALVRDGEILVKGRVVAEGTQPAWQAGTGRIAYVRNGRIYVTGSSAPVARGTHPAFPPPARVEQLLPDLVQRPPSGLVIGGGPGRWLLGFTSLVDNVGLGPLKIVGNRPPGNPRMHASQSILLANGAWVTNKDIAWLRYVNSPPHHHWHLMHYDTYEIRSLNGQVLLRDRKSGFCLADHYGIAPGNWPNRFPHFLGNCQQYNPEAKHVVEGTSLGFTDRYPAFFHGQNVNITGLPGGVYDLVHRVNANLALDELRYENDYASARIRISWLGGVPSVKLLRSCYASAVC
jgi:hypothetical protein